MAIKFACGSCGKRFTAKEEYVGRRSKCPKCGNDVEVPMPLTWQEDSTPVVASESPAPIASSSKVSTPPRCPSGTASGGDEPEPWKSSKAVPLRPRRRAILWAGVVAGLAGVGLIGFMGMRLLMPRPKQQARLASSTVRSTSKPAPERKVSTPKKPEEPLIVETKDMPDTAKLWIIMYIRDTLSSDPKNESVMVDGVEVRPVPEHSSRNPWLWEATATVSVAQKNPNPRQVSTHFSMAWRVFFQLTPEMKGGECWREVSDMRFAQKIRKHFEVSEWRPEFRSSIRLRWSQAFQVWDAEMERRGESSPDRAGYLRDLKQSKAAEFGLSIDELQEILEATN